MAIKSKIRNDRYPHTCRIYRSGEVNPFGDNGKETLLYEGECRIYANTSIRIFEVNTSSGRVISGDMAMAVPFTVYDAEEMKARGIQPFGEGDMFNAEDGNRTMHGIMISDVYIGTMGSIVGFSKTKN